MEQDIAAGKLIEFGEYKGNLYGTSSESVESIIGAGNYHNVTYLERMQSNNNIVINQRMEIVRICLFQGMFVSCAPTSKP